MSTPSDKYSRADHVAEGQLDATRVVVLQVGHITDDLMADWLELDAFESRMWRVLSGVVTECELVSRLTAQLPDEAINVEQVRAALLRMIAGGVVERRA